MLGARGGEALLRLLWLLQPDGRVALRVGRVARQPLADYLPRLFTRLDTMRRAKQHARADLLSSVCSLQASLCLRTQGSLEAQLQPRHCRRAGACLPPLLQLQLCFGLV